MAGPPLRWDLDPVLSLVGRDLPERASSTKIGSFWSLVDGYAADVKHQISLPFLVSEDFGAFG